MPPVSRTMLPSLPITRLQNSKDVDIVTWLLSKTQKGLLTITRVRTCLSLLHKKSCVVFTLHCLHTTPVSTTQKEQGAWHALILLVCLKTTPLLWHGFCAFPSFWEVWSDGWVICASDLAADSMVTCCSVLSRVLFNKSWMYTVYGESVCFQVPFWNVNV